MIPVTKPYLPDINVFKKYIDDIWSRQWLTNNGPLVIELEEQLKKHLQVNNLLFTNNGTIALQLAIKALNLKGEIITTPFSYVATTTSIIWENCTPIFVDIEPDCLCINPTLIEQSISKNTSAILATHVFGNPCDVEAIEKIAYKHNLKVIYDGAHAFGVNYNGKSIFNYGDISTCSFHATKLFHTAEGGAVICNNSELNEKIFLLRSFGHINDDYYTIGINGKNSELHAAVGLTILPHIVEIINKRKNIAVQYDELLKNTPIQKLIIRNGTEYNYAYYPVIFQSEALLLKIKNALHAEHINPRRYFYPSLNKLSYVQQDSCPVSESIANSIMCLPVYHELDNKTITKVCTIVNNNLQ